MKMNAPDPGDGIVIFEFDETNCVRDNTRRPVSEKMRKFIQDRLDRAERLRKAWEEEQKNKDQPPTE